MTLVIANVEVEGRRCDVLIAEGRVAEIGERLRGANELDARGGALIPGLIDHHIHLLALGAQAASLDVSRLPDGRAFEDAVRRRLAAKGPREWLRVTGYHERIAGSLDRHVLDRLAPSQPLRVQHQTGSLWVLNSAALAVVGDDPAAECIERDRGGAPTGRLWRGDAWLRSRIRDAAPDLTGIGADLAGMGLTGLTDASATTTNQSAQVLAAAGLRQKLMLMSAQPLELGPGYAVGACKILLDDHDLPPFDDLLAMIAGARRQQRPVAVHCVTAGELALTLAAFETAGSREGDRVEHGGIIPEDAIEVLRRLRLTVVTQPGFVAERGDRYLAEVEAADLESLYRCASLQAAGVPVAGSSDAPYTRPDPWAAMRAAVTRRTLGGAVIAPGERIASRAALDLYLGSFDEPGRRREIRVGEAADLCLLKTPMAEALVALDPSLVAATLVDGEVVYQAR